MMNPMFLQLLHQEKMYHVQAAFLQYHLLLLIKTNKINQQMQLQVVFLTALPAD